jgi:hypothetical protein
MLKGRVNLALVASLVALGAAEASWARGGTAAARPAEAVRPAALGATASVAAISASAATSAVNAATKSMVVSASTKQKLVDGLSSSNIEEVRAANDLLAVLKSSDTSAKSQALSALASGSLVGAAATVAKSQAAGQELLATAEKAAQRPNSNPGLCSNKPTVPANASRIIDASNPLKECGLSLPAFQVAVEVAAKAQADGNPNNDVDQMAAELDARNPNINGLQEGRQAVKKVFTECVNPTGTFAQQVKSI